MALLNAKSGVAAIGAILVSGCASVPMPTADIPYYLPKAENDMTIAVNLTCTADKTAVITGVAVTSAPHFIPDLDHPAQDKLVIPLGKENGQLSNVDMAISLQPDGRFSGLNASVAGQGSATIAAAAKLVAQAVPGLKAAGEQLAEQAVKPPFGLAPAKPESDIHKICTAIDKYGDGAAASAADGKPDVPKPDSGAGKMLTLTYHLNVAYVINPANATPAVEFTVLRSTPNIPDGLSPSSTDFIADFKSEQIIELVPLLNHLKFSVVVPTHSSALLKSITWSDANLPAGEQFVSLPLNKLGYVSLAIDGTVFAFDSSGNLDQAAKSKPLWQADMITPSRDTYNIPVPRGSAFGSGTAEVAVGDSGQVIKIHYSSKSTLADTLNSASSVVSAAPTP